MEIRNGDNGPGELERDSPLLPVGAMAFETVVSENWCSGTTPNGGYLMSLALRALARVLPMPDPITATAHYLQQVLIGPARVEVETIRIGRSLARGCSRLIQEGQERMRVIAAFGMFSPGSTVFSRPRGFELAPLEDCVELAVGTPGGGRSTVRERFDTRYDPASVSWVKGRPSGQPRIAAWVRPADGSIDRHLLPVLCDALPSTAYDMGVPPPVPTIELTVHQFGVAADGWVSGLWSSRHMAEGLMEESSEIWDSSGRLVALSHQVALISDPG